MTISRSANQRGLTPAILLRAYAVGIFPMADTRTDRTVHWLAPEWRGILPLESFHVPGRLRRTLRRRPFEIRCDSDFEAVISACAEPRQNHPDTWINRDIETVFCDLHRLGYAHSVETWQSGQLVGGLYGLALGGAFFGESMFSKVTDASKVALVHLVARLRIGGFTLLDTQFVTDHLRQFGAVEIASVQYLRRLEAALARTGRFYGDLPPEAEDAALSAVLTQSSTHTS